MRHERTEFTALREEAGLTVEDAAALLDVTVRTVYRYEEGKSTPAPAGSAHAAGRSKPSDSGCPARRPLGRVSLHRSVRRNRRSERDSSRSAGTACSPASGTGTRR